MTSSLIEIDLVILNMLYFVVIVGRQQWNSMSLFHINRYRATIAFLKELNFCLLYHYGYLWIDMCDTKRSFVWVIFGIFL